MKIGSVEAIRRGVSVAALVTASLAAAIAGAPAWSQSGSTSLPVAAAPADTNGPADASAPDAAVAAATDDSTTDIIVTRSRLATGFSAPTPVAVVGAARLQERGSNNIADALNEVPSFRASNTPAGGELTPNAGYVGGRILDLR